MAQIGERHRTPPQRLVDRGAAQLADEVEHGQGGVGDAESPVLGDQLGRHGAAVPPEARGRGEPGAPGQGHVDHGHAEPLPPGQGGGRATGDDSGRLDRQRRANAQGEVTLASREAVHAARQADQAARAHRPLHDLHELRVVARDEQSVVVGEGGFKARGTQPSR